jgi:hypothetical protein
MKARQQHVCASEPNFSGMRWDGPVRTPWQTIKATLFVALALLAARASAQVADMPQPALAHGNVALVTARYTPEAIHEGYPSRVATAAFDVGAGTVKGALVGAVMGAAVGLAIPLRFNPPANRVGPIYHYAGRYLVVSGALVGGTIGALGGAWKGISAAHANAIQAPTERPQHEIDLRGAIAERVLVAAADMPSYRISQVFGVETHFSGFAPSYAWLKDEGFDSVLEIAASTLGINDGQGAFRIALRARLVPLAVQEPIATREFSCVGKSQWISEWQGHDGAPLQEELDACYRSLSEQLVGFAFSRT